MSFLSRRRFLEDSMFAAAAAAAATSAPSLLAAEKKVANKAANETLGVAIVGVNGRGKTHINAFVRRPDTEILYIVDADEAVGQARCEEIGKKQGRTPKFVRDMREAFDDKSVDIVSTATPNHWHALCSIWAMQAGKDVYVEKPVSHNVTEGRRIVDGARKYNKICQTGTQCRSMLGSIEAIDFIKAGKIGEVKVARGLCYKPRGSIGARGTYEVPSQIDYDLWCGPAPMSPLTRPKLHYDWHWQWDAGNGDLGNQGIHQMDVGRWGLGVNQLSNAVFSYGGRLGYEDAGDTANTQVVVHDFGDKTLIFEVRGLKTDSYRGAKVGNVFYGTDGYVVLTSYDSGSAFDLRGGKIVDFKGEGDNDRHFDNFMQAVYSRNPEVLTADIEEGHLSSALCHTGNISYLLGEKVSIAEAKSRCEGDLMASTFDAFAEHLAENDVPSSAQISFGPKLVMDPKSETFPGNEKANQMLFREYRAGYEVPATADKV